MLRYMKEFDTDGSFIRPTIEKVITKGWLEPYSTESMMKFEQFNKRKESPAARELRKGNFEGFRRVFFTDMQYTREVNKGFDLEAFDAIYSCDDKRGLGLNLIDRVLPHFNGERVKNLCVLHHDGYGDAFLTLRYLPQTLKYADEISIIVPSAIRTLVSDNMPDGIKVFDKYDGVEALYRADAWAANETILAFNNHGYGDAKWINYPKHSNTDNKLRVGIVWAGSKSNWHNKLRSVPIESFTRLFEIQGIEWHSLQVGDFAYQCPDGVIDRSKDIKSWADTVNIVSTLDLVISVDTGTANLVGAMGFPLWVLTENHSDFRWGNAGESTPWFTSARIFRKGKDDKWKPVMLKVADALRSWKELA